MTLDEMDTWAAILVMQWYTIPGDDHWHVMGKSMIHKSKWQPTRKMSQAWQCLGSMASDYHWKHGRDWCELETKVASELTHKIYHAGFRPTPEAIVVACLRAKNVGV